MIVAWQFTAWNTQEKMSPSRRDGLISFVPLMRERKSIDLSWLNRLEDQFRQPLAPEPGRCFAIPALFCGHPGFLRFLRLLLALSRDSR
jgi:hypothetical protein